MRMSLEATLHRFRVVVAALSATCLVAGPVYAQGTVQPAKAPGASAAAPAAQPAKAPAAQGQPGSAAQQPPERKVVRSAPNAVGKPEQKVVTPNRVFVDINHATLKELKNIPGIGDVNGKKIIAGRPYANKSQLVSRNIIKADLYEIIQGMIVAKQ